MDASYDGYFEIAKFLIENNADVNIKDKVFLFFNIFFLFKKFLCKVFLLFFFSSIKCFYTYFQIIFEFKIIGM
jgi:hypothetical protein